MKNRYRLLYQKGQELRYTANLDLHKIFERWMRRASLPLAYSQGFHPQPRLNQAAPLPLGMLSQYELIEFWLEAPMMISEVKNALLIAPQPGIAIEALDEVPLKHPSIQTLVDSASYRASQIDPSKPYNGAEEKVEALLSAPSILRTRREKAYDLRPLILECHVLTIGSQATFDMSLRAHPGQTGRPDEVIAALGYDPLDFRYLRTFIKLKDA